MMKTLALCLAGSTAALYFAGLLSFGSPRAAGVSLAWIAAGTAALALALRLEKRRHRLRSRRSGRSLAIHETHGIRTYHPDGTEEFSRYGP